MGNRVPVWHSSIVEASIVPTGSPVARFFRDHVEWGRPRALGRANNPQVQHVLKFPLHHVESLRGKASCFRSDSFVAIV